MKAKKPEVREIEPVKVEKNQELENLHENLERQIRQQVEQEMEEKFRRQAAEIAELKEQVRQLQAENLRQE